MIAGGGAPIGQGGPNRVSDHYGVVAGGLANQVGNASGDPGDAQFATVGGGWDNLARQVGATVAGGSINLADGDRATVGGGLGNSAMGTYATVAGGSFNRAEAMNAFVGGGAFNTASNTSFVGGGQNNTASGTLATVVGGLSNQASGNLSSVGGGTFNTASAPTSVVAGGGNNTASGGDAGILAGEGNQAVGTRSVVVGGYRSVAMARESTVSGGFENCAGAEFSWAGGHRAVARPGAGPPTFSACTLSSYPGGAGDRGTFVWADSGDDRFVSTGPNQFLVRAEGGAAINHNDPAGNALRVAGTLQVDALATEGVAPLCRNAAGRIAQCSSSGRYKTAIAELDLGLAAVKKLRAIAFTWTGSGAEDLGFVAEEIATLDERLITRNATGEIEGVRYERLTAVLAKAVQELSARESIVVESLARLEGENAALRAELVQRDAELRARLDALEARTPAH
jgi:hypothetical protein